MKAFNITTQKKAIDQKRSFFNEYFYRMNHQVDSLYEYLHYYTPEWRTLGAESGSTLYYTDKDNNRVTAENIVNGNNLDICKLNFRWGFKNRENFIYYYGPLSDRRTLNIGAIIYKKDSNDININSSDLYSHFIVFESALAQYFNWVLQSGIKDGNPTIDYITNPYNELDFGLNYKVQIAEQVPRYYFWSDANAEYYIDFSDSTLAIDVVYDYNNINLQVIENGVKTPSDEELSGRTVYQKWQGNSEIFTEAMILQNGHYEEIIGDIIHFQNPGHHSELQVRYDNNRSDSSSIQRNTVVILC